MTMTVETTKTTNPQSVVLRVFEAVGFRIANDPDARSQWEQLLVSTWSNRDDVWQPGRCKGCAKMIASQASEIDNENTDNPFLAAIRSHVATVCGACTRLADDHYHNLGRQPVKAGWWETNCPPTFQTLLADRTAEKVDWRRVETVEKWNFKRKAKGLILTGDTGSGKTTALWGLARRLKKEGRHLYLLTSIELSRRLQAAAKEMQADHDLLHCDFLLIDDLGKEKLTTTVGAALYELMDQRLAHNRWMAFTTRFTGDQLEDRFIDTHLGRDIRRRIQDACTHLRFKGGGI